MMNWLRGRAKTEPAAPAEINRVRAERKTWPLKLVVYMPLGIELTFYAHGEQDLQNIANSFNALGEQDLQRIRADLQLVIDHNKS